MSALYHRLTAALLRWLRVPPEPQPPHGDPASLRVFRAGHNHLKLKLLGWGLTQLGAFAGILFWLWVFVDLDIAVDEIHHRAATRREAPAAAPATPPAPAPAEAAAPTAPATAPQAQTPAPRKKRARSGNSYSAWRSGAAQFLARLPAWAFPLLWALKLAGLVAYLLQLPVTYALARLDFDLRWYMVTDRSLRIRHGIWKINEATMSFANVQQVVVTQGPLQRLLGLADVRVTSAGGGGGGDDKGHAGADDAMHNGLFHNVTNAPEIRDLIQDRLRRFRESGLGDPDEKNTLSPALSAPADTEIAGGTDDALAAARELVAEARALRRELAG